MLIKGFTYFQSFFYSISGKRFKDIYFFGENDSCEKKAHFHPKEGDKSIEEVAKDFEVDVLNNDE